MRVEFLGGKKSNHCFMPYVNVMRPEDWDISDCFDDPTDDLAAKAISRAASLYPNRGRVLHESASYASRSGELMRLRRRENSVKAICRWAQKQGFKPGTIIIAYNWYIGHADIAITV